jgi:D-serine deaminase-like pyridoxal phosphate-dependent protein
MLIDNLDTPFPMVDLDIVERNLKRGATYFAEREIPLRPHIKTHKIPEFARRQIALGACGVTCQKLGEAETMADGGIEDILLTFPIWGRDKLARLEALARRTTMSAVTDSVEVAEGLASVGARIGKPLNILVECDVGGARCGVQNPDAAIDLAKRVAGLPGARFTGLMTYPPMGQIPATQAWFDAVFAGLAKAGLEAKAASIGGTPEMYRSHELAFPHEHRPGTYIYSDRYMARYGVGTLDDCALRIVATVVSRPTGDRAILDAGSKTLSSDLMGFVDHGHILEYPEAKIAKLSEEHGHVDLSLCAAKPGIGERVTIVPNHACVVSNLFDAVAAVSNGHFERMLRVEARGLVR